MALSFRHQAILDVARNIGRVAVDDLAERLTVTPQTIRRDLNDLCDQGHLPACMIGLWSIGMMVSGAGGR